MTPRPGTLWADAESDAPGAGRLVVVNAVTRDGQSVWYRTEVNPRVLWWCDALDFVLWGRFAPALECRV